MLLFLKLHRMYFLYVLKYLILQEFYNKLLLNENASLHTLKVIHTNQDVGNMDYYLL